GNSDMFSLLTRDLRPDGSTNNKVSGTDLIFGGSGTAIARNAIGDATIDVNGNITTSPNGHANDSDAIVGDKGDIIRLVGVNGTAAPPAGQQTVANLMMNAFLTTTAIPTVVQSYNGFLRFNYDTGTHDSVGNASNVAYDDTVKIVVRAVRLLDYT